MLVLLNQAWPWITIGLVLVSWGVLSLPLNLAQWIKLCFNLIFTNFSDQTQREKKEISSTPIEEAMTSNVGCALMLLGVVCLLFGVVRWIG